MQSNGQVITLLRERSGFSKTELATAAGVERTQLHRIEIGERNGTESQICSIAKALKVPVTAIIRDLAS